MPSPQQAPDNPINKCLPYTAPDGSVYASYWKYLNKQQENVTALVKAAKKADKADKEAERAAKKAGKKADKAKKAAKAKLAVTTALQGLQEDISNLVGPHLVEFMTNNPGVPRPALMAMVKTTMASVIDAVCPPVPKTPKVGSNKPADVGGVHKITTKNISTVLPSYKNKWRGQVQQRNDTRVPTQGEAALEPAKTDEEQKGGRPCVPPTVAERVAIFENLLLSPTAVTKAPLSPVLQGGIRHITTTRQPKPPQVAEPAAVKEADFDDSAWDKEYSPRALQRVQEGPQPTGVASPSSFPMEDDDSRSDNLPLASGSPGTPATPRAKRDCRRDTPSFDHSSDHSEDSDDSDDSDDSEDSDASEYRTPQPQLRSESTQVPLTYPPILQDHDMAIKGVDTTPEAARTEHVGAAPEGTVQTFV